MTELNFTQPLLYSVALFCYVLAESLSPSPACKTSSSSTTSKSSQTILIFFRCLAAKTEYHLVLISEISLCRCPWSLLLLDSQSWAKSPEYSHSLHDDGWFSIQKQKMDCRFFVVANLIVLIHLPEQAHFFWFLVCQSSTFATSPWYTFIMIESQDRFQFAQFCSAQRINIFTLGRSRYFSSSFQPIDKTSRQSFYAIP